MKRDDNWITTFTTVKTDVEQGTITLYCNSMNGEQVVLIHPLMPFWIFKANTNFKAIVPRRCIRQHNLLTVEWRGFYPPLPYEWMTDDEVDEYWMGLWEKATDNLSP